VRRAKNEVLFRNLNERLKQLDDRLDTRAVGAPAQEREEFFCECGQLECMARFETTREQYESVREHPEQFMVLQGHVEPDIERVVEEHGPDHAVAQRRCAGIDLRAHAVGRVTDPRS